MSVQEIQAISPADTSTFPSLAGLLSRTFRGTVEWIQLDYNGVTDTADFSVSALAGVPEEKLRDALAAAFENWLTQAAFLGIPLLGVRGYVRIRDAETGENDGLPFAAIAELKALVADLASAVKTHSPRFPEELYLSLGYKEGRFIVFLASRGVEVASEVRGPMLAIRDWARRNAAWFAGSGNLGYLFRISPEPVAAATTTH